MCFEQTSICWTLYNDDTGTANTKTMGFIMIMTASYVLQLAANIHYILPKFLNGQLFHFLGYLQNFLRGDLATRFWQWFQAPTRKSNLYWLIQDILQRRIKHGQCELLRFLKQANVLTLRDMMPCWTSNFVQSCRYPYLISLSGKEADSFLGTPWEDQHHHGKHPSASELSRIKDPLLRQTTFYLKKIK